MVSGAWFPLATRQAPAVRTLRAVRGRNEELLELKMVKAGHKFLICVRDIAISVDVFNNGFPSIALLRTFQQYRSNQCTIRSRDYCRRRQYFSPNGLRSCDLVLVDHGEIEAFSSTDPRCDKCTLSLESAVF